MKVGFILTVYGDEAGEALTALNSFYETCDYDSDVLLVGSNLSDDAAITLSSYRFLNLPKTSLTHALNRGITYFRTNPEYGYIGWIHPDMAFPEPWVAALVRRLKVDPSIGKIHPNNIRDGRDQPERPGNETPWIIPVHIFDDAGIFDEGFIGGGGAEDWDLNKRIINSGYNVLIVPDSAIMHTAMATRAREGTTSDSVLQQNMAYYYRKWNTYNPPV